MALPRQMNHVRGHDLGSVWVVDCEFDVARLESVYNVGDDRLFCVGAVTSSLSDQFDGVLFELWEERQPALTNGPRLMVDRVIETFGMAFGERVVLPVAALVTPLIRMHVVERRRVLVPRGHTPVAPKRWLPRRRGDDLLLADVVGQAAAVDTDRTGQHEGRDRRAVEQVVVIPVVGASPDDDHVLAVGEFAVAAPLPSELDDGVAVDAACTALATQGCRAHLRRRSSWRRSHRDPDRLRTAP